jgi:hypothetical protein
MQGGASDVASANDPAGCDGMILESISGNDLNLARPRSSMSLRTQRREAPVAEKISNCQNMMQTN